MYPKVRKSSPKARKVSPNARKSSSKARKVSLNGRKVSAKLQKVSQRSAEAAASHWVRRLIGLQSSPVRSGMSGTPLTPPISKSGVRG